MSGKVEYFEFPALNNIKNSNLLFAIELDTLRFQENEDLLRFLEFGCASGSDLLNYYHKSIQEYNKNKEKRKQIKYSELCDASFLRLSRANMRKIIEEPYNRYELEDYSISFTKFSLMTKKVSYYERFGYISPNINFIICSKEIDGQTSDYFCPIETNSGSIGGQLYANKLLYSKAIFNEVAPETYLNKILEHRKKFFVRKVNISGLFQVNLGNEIEVKSGKKHTRNLVIQKMLVLFKQSNSEIVKTINKYEIGVIREDLEFLKDLLEQKIISDKIETVDSNFPFTIDEVIFTEHNLIYFRDYYQKLEILIVMYPNLTLRFLFELCEKMINLCPYFNNFSELNNHISRNIYTLFDQIDSVENNISKTELFKEISIILKAIPPPRKKLSKDLSNLKKIVIYELESVLNSNIQLTLYFTDFNEANLTNILDTIGNDHEGLTPTTYNVDNHNIGSMSHCFNDFKIELHDKTKESISYIEKYKYYYGLLIKSNNNQGDLIVNGGTIADIFNFFWMSLNYVVNNIKKYPSQTFKDYGKFLHDLFFVPNPKTRINLLRVYSISPFDSFSKPIIHNLKYLYDTKKTTNVKYFDYPNLVLCKGDYQILSKDEVTDKNQDELKINSVKEIGGVKFTTSKFEYEEISSLKLHHPRQTFPDSCLKSEIVFIDSQGMEAFFNEVEENQVTQYNDTETINEETQETTYNENLSTYTKNLKDMISLTLTSIHILIRDFVGGTQGGGGGREMNGGGGSILKYKVPNLSSYLGSPTNMLMSVVEQVFEGTKTTISLSSVIIGEIKTKIEELVYNPFNSVEKDFLNGLPKENFDEMKDPIEMEIIFKVLKNLQKKIQDISKPNSLHRYYSDDYVERRMREKTALVVSLHDLKVRLSYYDSIADGIKDGNLTTQFGKTIANHIESEFGVFSREFNRSEIIQNFLERHPKEF